MTTIVARDDALRVAFNRDERRDRSVELPPTVHRCGDRTAIMPLDHASGGTWIGANDAGLIAAVLNVNPAGASTLVRPVSRGSLVPHVMACVDLDDVGHLLRALDVTTMGRFRLVVLGAFRNIDACSDGERIAFDGAGLPRKPMLWTSSSLGDETVRPARLQLFRELVTNDPRTQDAFHQHAWPADGARSVLMSRPDARTMSRIVVSRADDRIEMAYEYLDEAGAVAARSRADLSLAFCAGAWS